MKLSEVNPDEEEDVKIDDGLGLQTRPPSTFISAGRARGKRAVRRGFVEERGGDWSAERGKCDGGLTRVSICLILLVAAPRRRTRETFAKGACRRRGDVLNLGEGEDEDFGRSCGRTCSQE